MGLTGNSASIDWTRNRKDPYYWRIPAFLGDGNGNVISLTEQSYTHRRLLMVSQIPIDDLKRDEKKRKYF